ncbi:AAA family ATPase [Tepidibacillus infernus]|uniref:AAA family ATPase n=1 Tax=Tepidibacillus decaturensis TaxID=1413211 RepID=A0A135L7W1_9BACI|nr:ATP-binding protein [Tepidibacillus decaturensis]KXG45085.1 AAA family ATPase [Tepidibacillus decaturensis]
MNAVYKQLPSLIRASLEGDIRTVEMSALSIIRKIKEDDPKLSMELAEIISTYSAGAPLTRSIGITPPPVDNESFMSLVNVNDSTTFDEIVVLDNHVERLIKQFLAERKQISKLIANDLKPPNSILFYGPPGVGKTLLSKFIAHSLSLPLITLDLSSAISSYLGKTGQNLKKVLDYGKNNPSVLLLDEFDAVAKRRDDPTDLGELKRIVNVLLKELEEWPTHSIIIGATNHHEFLDKAIWRRFDLKIEIPLPGEEQRFKLWKLNMNKGTIEIQDIIIKAIAKAFNHVSPSDIKQISQYVLRQTIINGSDPIKVLIEKLREVNNDDRSNFNKILIFALKEIYEGKISQAKIANLLGISVSTVNHHLKSSIK